MREAGTTQGTTAIWKAALRNLAGNNRRQFIVTHLAYTALGITVFYPLVGLLGKLLLRLSGRPALSDQEIAYFLLTPFGMASGILFASILISILAFEQASMMAIAAGTAGTGHIRARDTMPFTFARAGRILAFALRLVARVLLLTLPFIALTAGAAWMLVTDYDINYYLTARPTAFLAAVAVAGLLLSVMTAVIVRRLLGWSLALPLVLFSGVPPSEAFAESTRLTEGKKRRLLAVLAAWALLVFALGAVVLGAVQLLGSRLIPVFSGSLGQLVPVLGGLFAVWVTGNFLVTAFSSGSFACILIECFERYGPGVVPGEAEIGLEGGRSRKRILSAQGIVVLLLGAGAAAVLAGTWLLRDFQLRDDALVVAHRGAAGKAPENTLAAVRKAVEDGADWVEIDVQETADGEIVVIHDSDFMKLSGVNLKVWDGTFEQVREIDAGRWFGPEFEGEQVPTLAEVLEEVRGRSRLVIELKYYGHDQQLEQRVVDVVEQAGMEKEVAVMSLKYGGIEKIRALRPDWTIGLLSTVAVGNLSGLDADFLAVNTGSATSQFIRRAHAAEKQVFVWTINDPVTVSRMASLGVDGIITDEPDMTRRALGHLAELSLEERLLIHAAVLFGRPVPERLYRDDSP